MPSILSQRFIDEQLSDLPVPDEIVHPRPRRKPMKVTLAFWKETHQVDGEKRSIYRCAKLENPEDGFKLVSEGPGLFNIATRVIQDCVDQGIAFDVVMHNPPPFQYNFRRTSSGKAYGVTSFSNKDFDSIFEILNQVKPTPKKVPTYISDAQWKEYLEEAWEEKPPGHLSKDELVLYADTILGQGESKAQLFFQDTVAHFGHCELCRNQLNRLIEVVENAGGG